MSGMCEAALDLCRDSGPRPTLLSGHVDGVKGAVRPGGRTLAGLSLPLISQKDMSWASATPFEQGEDVL